MSGQRRYEIKYTCSPEKLSYVLSWIENSDAFFKIQYPQREVNSLYFDTYGFNDASSNLIGLGNRKKLRLRWYGSNNEQTNIVAEYKYKVNGTVGKSSIPLGSFSITSIRINELKEIVSCLEKRLAYDIRINNPVLRVHYHRDYYCNHDKSIRITIDKDLYFSPVNSIDASIMSNNNISQPYNVIEFKYDIRNAKEAANYISNFPLRPVRHSKYLASFSILNNISY
jgi:SPX domain protein involved in polyphosphate accumulation